MIPQTFSLEMCRLLSSLAPKFEGHWTYVVITNIYSRIGHDTKKFKQPDEVHLLCKRELEYFSSVGGEAKAEFIPAWQVEDVLRNAHKLFGDEMVVCKKIAWFFVAYQDIVYQKIEEYLWSVLK